jgi:hypothetical protein
MGAHPEVQHVAILSKQKKKDAKLTQGKRHV